MSRKHLAKILGLAVTAALVISAVAAAAASAHTWTISGSNLASGSSETVAAELAAGSTATLTGTLLGQEFVLNSTKLTSEEGKITQGSNAEDSGKLVFSELTVVKPAGCHVTSPIRTKALKTELVSRTGDEQAYDKFTPASGETFATIEVFGCAVEGLYNVKGVAYGKGNAWGTEAVNQPLEFTPAINELFGAGLTLGTNPATLTANGTNHLTGPHAGQVFGAIK